MHAKLLLLGFLLLPIFSTEALRYMRYRWVQGQECFPVSNFDIITEHCWDNVTILGTRTRCACNHTTNELMLITASWTLNATGNGFTNYSETVSERYFLGACYRSPWGSDRIIFLADTQNVCGPTIEDVVAHGKPFDAASWTAYAAHTGAPNWAQSSDNSEKLYSRAEAVITGAAVAVFVAFAL